MKNSNSTTKTVGLVVVGALVGAEIGKKVKEVLG